MYHDKDKNGRLHYVLQYKQFVSLDDALLAVEESGADIERALSCTRGLVLSFENEPSKGQELLSATEGFSLVPLEAAPHRGRFLENSKECQCGDYTGGGCTLTRLDIALIQEYIVDTIETWDTDGEDSVDVVGALLRLAFHDRASFSKNTKNTLNGMNGCLDLSDPGNAGLESVVNLIFDFQQWVSTAGDSSIGKYVSKADMTALAGLTAVSMLLEDMPDVEVLTYFNSILITHSYFLWMFLYPSVGIPLQPARRFGPRQPTTPSSVVRIPVWSRRYFGRDVRCLRDYLFAQGGRIGCHEHEGLSRYHVWTHALESTRNDSANGDACLWTFEGSQQWIFGYQLGLSARTMEQHLLPAHVWYPVGQGRAQCWGQDLYGMEVCVCRWTSILDVLEYGRSSLL